MDLISFSFHPSIPQDHYSQWVQATLRQLNKDFALAGISFQLKELDSPENAMKVLTDWLRDASPVEINSLIYILDIHHHSVHLKPEDMAVAILKRAFSKVWLRHRMKH